MINEIWLRDKKLLGELINKNAVDNKRKGILEKQIFALYLLEKLLEANIYFIFKGGTSLLLLLDEVHRFSTDIDILITKPNLEKVKESFKNFVGENCIFTKYETDIRTDTKFPKIHFRFYYSSVYNESYILLDAVFEDNPYLEIIQKEIKANIIETNSPYILVNIPSITDIMIDKLTAFAPNTIGVKYFREYGNIKKERKREVIKQLFDVNELFLSCKNFSNLNIRYQKLAKFELEQRELSGSTYIDCLKDSLDTLLIYLSKGSRNKKVYNYLLDGLNGFKVFPNILVGAVYMTLACVNIIELISFVLCDNQELYESIYEKSKEKILYDNFVKEKQLQAVAKSAKAISHNEWNRVIRSLRVISNYIDY
ncbi:MAG: nucleotidyl transferase AbiEii/AbiGii toxin family protein [Bacillales bacterium]|jgi:predicted nucleotidyltransferase component of viral defense system|nr:nucleotidyl transferase AbiEii/AbiGii toxin family protein [Bacillales bacterium]